MTAYDVIWSEEAGAVFKATRTTDSAAPEPELPWERITQAEFDAAVSAAESE